MKNFLGRLSNGLLAVLVLSIALVGIAGLSTPATVAADPPDALYYDPPTPSADVDPPAPSAFGATDDSADACNGGFLGLRPWYHYMKGEFKPGSCEVKCFNILNEAVPNECGQSNSDVPLVLLAVVDDALRISAVVAVAFVMVSAFRFVTSQGEPEKRGRAQDSLVNALIGLAIALIAVAFVSFVGSKLGGTVV